MTKRQRFPHYLKRRAGKTRSGSRFYIRVPIPSDLRDRFGRLRHVERGLGTSDPEEAQRRSRAEIDQILAMFDRMRAGGPLLPDEIRSQAERELRRAYDTLAADFLSAHGQLPDFARMMREDLSSHAMAAVNANPMLGGATTADYAEQLIRRAGAEPSEETLGALSEAILRAQAAAVAMLQKGLAPPPLPGAAPLQRSKRGTAPSMSKAAAEFVAERMRDPSEAWTAQTKKQNESVYRLFADHVGDCPADTVTSDDATSFRSAVARLRPDWARSAKAKGLPLVELLQRYGAKDGAPGLSNKTLDRYTSALVSLFRWLKLKGHYRGDNPFSGLMTRLPKGQRKQRKERTKWLPFNEAELGKLFHHPLLIGATYEERTAPRKHSTQTALMWLPLVALFSGMRAEEIAGLHVADMREESGVRYFDVVEREGRTVKTVSSRRRVPVHSALVQFGFLDYVEHVRHGRHEFLFPGLKPGGPDKKRIWYFSRAFTAYRRDVGVERIDPRTKRNRVSFHSLRANVATRLENRRVPESEAVHVLGHEKMSMSYGLYSEGLDLASLQRAVESVGYPDLDLSHLKAPKAKRTKKRR